MPITNEICRSIYKKIPFLETSAFLCALVILLQATCLNYIITTYQDWKWWFLYIGDVIVIILFIASFTLSLRQNKSFKECNKPILELPLGYISWIVYGVFLTFKVGFIFEHIAPFLKEEDLFGPNGVRTVIASTGITFYLLVSSQNNASHGSQRQLLISSIRHDNTLHILDSVAILDILFIQESHIFLSFNLHRAINVIACINLVVPFIPLIILSKASYGRKEYSISLTILLHLSTLCSIDVPLFTIRLYLWHSLGQDISVFIIKNLIGIGTSLYNIYEYFLKLPSTKKVDSEDPPDDETTHL